VHEKLYTILWSLMQLNDKCAVKCINQSIPWQTLCTEQQWKNNALPTALVSNGVVLFFSFVPWKFDVHLLIFTENMKCSAMGLIFILVTYRIACNHLIYSMVNKRYLSHPWAKQLFQEDLADAGILCDTVAVHKDTIKVTPAVSHKILSEIWDSHSIRY
jgi:hypothetical protein